MTKQITDAIDALEAAGFAAAKGLRAIAASQEPTRLNIVATKYYQDSPQPVARVAEMLIDAGQLIDATTNRWWPTQIDRLRALDFSGYTVRGNPPVVETRDAETGHLVTARVSGLTQNAVDTAIAELQATLRARQSRTRQLIRAELEIGR